VDVDHSMRIMTEASFGPVVGIMPVDSDAQALALMNDSEFGLTASIWSRDIETALALGDQVETGPAAAGARISLPSSENPRTPRSMVTGSCLLFAWLR
jgi:acyl-CoA reductase-like NAD-dependent aldehyde dehydrogenase